MNTYYVDAPGNADITGKVYSIKTGDGKVIMSGLSLVGASNMCEYLNIRDKSFSESERAIETRRLTELGPIDL